MTLYKVLIHDARGRYRSFYRDFTPYLPYFDGQEWLPGRWMPKESNGYFLTTEPELHGLPGDPVFEAEGHGEPWDIDGEPDQVVFESIRLLRRFK